MKDEEAPVSDEAPVTDEAASVADGGPSVSDRLPFHRAELRGRTLRGVMVTAGFLVGIDAVVLAQGLSSRGCSGRARSAFTASFPPP